MDIFEKINKTFAGWYESWFGDAFGDIRPKDVLRKIIGAMEDNRKEGLDNRVYVPNKYILEITFENDEEREYLLAFLDKDELESALRKYLNQNKYFLRGPFDFTIEEVPLSEDVKRDKLSVKCKWDIRQFEHEPEPDQQIQGLIIPELAVSLPSQPFVPDEEEYTVASTDVYDAGTVAPPSLTVKHVNGSTEFFILSKPVVTIGRSRRLNNDLVIEDDGMISKRHAQITMAAEGFKIADLNSTNGVWLNDERIINADLKSGDIIRLGVTEFIFDQASAGQAVSAAAKAAKQPCPKLISETDTGYQDEFPLASEVIIGRSLGSDLRFDHHSVSRRHARVYREGSEFFVEDLGSSSGTLLNNMSLKQNTPVRLRNGDQLKFGEVELYFEVG
ncbi:MAG: FhaA domain-containing protein [Armatimonadota bacterium]